MRKTAPSWRSVIGRRIKVHDRHQIELKLEYKPIETERQSRYVVETFICVPSSLKISRDSVSREQLYADIHNYVRLMTPELSFAELGALPTSPLVRVAEELEVVERGGDPRRFIYECKMLASIFRGNLRDLSHTVVRELERLRGGDAESLARIEETVTEGLDGAASILERTRRLYDRTQAAGLPDRARAAFRMADEFMSVVVEQRLRPVIVAVARAKLAPGTEMAATRLKRRLLDRILAEETYRRGRGYPTIIDPASDNEPYLYRAGLLKKFCSSALFLEIRRAHTRRTWQELAFAVAAGIAMAFATVVAFWAQARYSAIGMQLFLILVVAYMFKDRIKEMTRGYFSRMLDRGFYDRKIVVEDPAGGSFGTLHEKIDYLPRERLPDDVQEVRRRGVDPTTRIAQEELSETIIYYKKEIKLSSQRLLERGGGLTDILRFHISRLLHDMDEPDQEIEYIDAESHTLDALRAAKTYHVDVVFRFFARRGRAPRTTLMRLILDRNGIKRIERSQLGPSDAGSAEMSTVAV